MRFDIPSLDGTEILTIEFRDGEDTAHTISRRPASKARTRHQTIRSADNLGRSVGMIQTASGILYDVVDPKPERVRLDDIAHHLSQQCRYSGATKRFYCPTPEQRILTADFRWVPAGDLKIGDQLVGFDEHPQIVTSKKKRRRFKPSTVLSATPVRRRVYLLEMEDGSTVRASAEHPWLVSTKQSRNQQWMRTEEIVEAVNNGQKRFMHRFFTPWVEYQTRDAGYLAGLYDGEGHLSFLNRKGIQMGVAQKPGLVLDEMYRLHQHFGFSKIRRSTVGQTGVQSLQIKGGWREAMRLLGAIRPLRLLVKMKEGLLSGKLEKEMNGQGAPPRVVRAHLEGQRWCAGLETSTRTYFCEGYAAHNSVAEHSIWVSLIVPPKYAREALLHDAAEAYCIDLPRPIKHLPEMGHYRELEWRNERAIVERFGLSTTTIDDVVVADVEALACECRQLMPWRDADWWWGDLARRPLGDATREASYVFQTRDYEERRFTELLRFEPDPIEVRSTFLRRAKELGLT